MEHWKDRFDTFVEDHNLPEIWADGLFGYDPSRVTDKKIQAWIEFCNLMDQGEREPTAEYLRWALRQACGMPTKRVNGDFRTGQGATQHGLIDTTGLHSGYEIYKRKLAKQRATTPRQPTS